MFTHRTHELFRLLFATLFTALIGVSCSDVAFESQPDAYPTLSLVGAPEDRDVTFDLSISGPGMETIGPIELARGQRVPPLEIPAGRNRRIAIVSQNDVYAGRVTASFAPGTETTVNVPIYPGPVFMDLAGGDSETPPRLVQIRDLSAEPGSGTVRSLAANPFATDVEYAADGTAWSLQFPESEGSGPFFAGIDEFSSAEPVATIGYGSVDDLGPPTAMAIDSRNGRIAVAELPAET